MPTDTCWICGEEANSGEHFIKASDLRSVFGKITTKHPLYKKVNGKNIIVQGITSDKLKYSVKLCAKCNGCITQRYDMAWEKLSLYLRERRPRIVGNSIIRLDLIFPGTVRKSMLHVHLYFLKQFGCIIKEHDVPIDMSEFSSCINNVKAHRNVWISIWGDAGKGDSRRVAITPVTVTNVGENVVGASWRYVVDTIAVNVIYTVPPNGSKGLEYAWHPDFLRGKITLAGREYWEKQV